MKLEVFFSPEEVENEYDLRDKAVVVVDVLRASTSIIAAIHNGARQVIPVATVSDAMRLSKDMFDDSTILCGEKAGKLIDGFDIDNSPANYRAEVVKDKSILYTSSNGSGAILRVKYAKDVFIGAFVNMTEIVRNVRNYDEIAVLCAGNARHFAMEDGLCAGMIVSRLQEIQPAAVLSDAARLVKVLYEKCADSLMATIRECSHGRELDDDGFGADVTFCATVDVYKDVPRLDGTVIRSTKGKKKFEV